MEMARMSFWSRIVALLALLFGGLLVSSVGATSASASDGRIGALLTNNELWAKDGSPHAQWTQIATGAKSFSMDGNRIGYLTTAGVAYGKEGASLTSAWTNIGPAGQKSLVVGAYPPRTMIVNPAEDLYVQEGPYATAPGGVYLAGRVGRTAAADGRLAFINTDSIALRTEEGSLSGATWNFQLIGSTEIALSGHRIVTLLNNGELWAKQGSQDDQWYLLRTGVAHIAASGTRVAAIDTNGKLYVMDKWAISSVTSADWVYEVAASVDVALDNDRIGVVLNNGELWIKEGSLGAPWIFELNNAVKVDLAHRDVTGPAISVSGSLRDAPNPLVGGSLNITLDDNAASYTESGAAGYKLSETNGTVLAQGTRVFSDCPFYWCAAVALQASATIDPVALGWSTGVHHLVLEGQDMAGNTTTQSWDVSYYKTSWLYGGANHSVDTGGELQAVLAALAAVGWDSSEGATLLAGLSPANRAYVDQQLDPPTDLASVLDPNILVPPEPGSAGAAHTFHCDWKGQQSGAWERPLPPYLSNGNVNGIASFVCDENDAGRAVNMRTCIEKWELLNTGAMTWVTIRCDDQTWTGYIGPPTHSRHTYRPCSGGSGGRLYRVAARMTVYTVWPNALNPIAVSNRTSPLIRLQCRAG